MDNVSSHIYLNIDSSNTIHILLWNSHFSWSWFPVSNQIHPEICQILLDFLNFSNDCEHEEHTGKNQMYLLVIVIHVLIHLVVTLYFNGPL